MRASHRTVGFRELGQQPLHFVLLQLHVDFDGGMAGDGSGYARAHSFQIDSLILA